MKLQVAGFLDNSLVNGQGFRSVLFVSGCKHNCCGCHNKDMQNYSYGENVEINKIYDKIIKNTPLIKGVTFSGGEPFDSAKGLATLAEKLKAKGLDIWCYTGYTFEEILSNSNNMNWHGLLQNIDVLVDGKFESSLSENAPKYVGSSNQRIIDVKESLKYKQVKIKKY